VIPAYQVQGPCLHHKMGSVDASLVVAKVADLVLAMLLDAEHLILPSICDEGKMAEIDVALGSSLRCDVRAWASFVVQAV
jgi:hypothetical protein